MALGRSLVFVVLAIFVFASLMVFLPSEFRPVGSYHQDPLINEVLEASNLIVYENQGSDETFMGYSSLYDAPSPPQWNISETPDNYVEVWFDEPFAVFEITLQLRHVYWLWAWYETPEWFQWYYTDGSLASTGVSGTTVGQWYLPKEALTQAWNPLTNSSSFTAKTTQIVLSIVIKYNQTTYSTIEEAYDDGVLFYALSYEWSPENTAFAVLGVVTKLLTFQGLGLGIPGIFGTLIDGIISMFFYVAIAYLAYKFIAGLIPLISGGGGD